MKKSTYKQKKSQLTDLEKRIVDEIEKGDITTFNKTNPDDMPHLNGWVIPGFSLPVIEIIIIIVGLSILYLGMSAIVRKSGHFPEPCQTYTYSAPITGEITRYCIGEGPNPTFGK